MNNDKTIKRFESFPVWFWCSLYIIFFVQAQTQVGLQPGFLLQFKLAFHKTNLANVESSQFNFEKVLAAKTAWVLENRGQMLRSGKTGKTHVATSCNFWVKTAGKDWNLSVQTTRCSFQQHFQNRAKESQRKEGWQQWQLRTTNAGQLSYNKRKAKTNQTTSATNPLKEASFRDPPPISRSLQTQMGQRNGRATAMVWQSTQNGSHLPRRGKKRGHNEKM